MSDISAAVKKATGSNIVPIVSITAAVVTSFIVKPDHTYIGYFDFKTLTCLFCMLAVICAFKNIHFFEIVSRRIIVLFKDTRSVILVLVYITFTGSMFITNDMALITFLPLSYFVLQTTKQKKYLAFTFIMQDIAANLGGMLTPFGNPQNMYLYSYFNIPYAGFVKVMFLPFVISVALITLCCLLVKKVPLELPGEYGKEIDIKKALIYSLLFAFSIALIFRAIPYWAGLIVIPSSLFILDKKALADIDYPLMLTFCAFFVFSGNVSRMPLVSEFFNVILSKSTMLTGVISCQFISNVPSAILLSRFTANYQPLLVAVNIGGAGTLVASLASLITYNEYRKNNPNKQWNFLKKFSLYNFGFLIILTVICMALY